MSCVGAGVRAVGLHLAALFGETVEPFGSGTLLREQGFWEFVASPYLWFAHSASYLGLGVRFPALATWCYASPTIMVHHSGAIVKMNILFSVSCS